MAKEQSKIVATKPPLPKPIITKPFTDAVEVKGSGGKVKGIK
jgi:hypothetical protein